MCKTCDFRTSWTHDEQRLENDLGIQRAVHCHGYQLHRNVHNEGSFNWTHYQNISLSVRVLITSPKTNNKNSIWEKQKRKWNTISCAFIVYSSLIRKMKLATVYNCNLLLICTDNHCLVSSRFCVSPWSYKSIDNALLHFPDTVVMFTDELWAVLARYWQPKLRRHLCHYAKRS